LLLTILFFIAVYVFITRRSMLFQKGVDIVIFMLAIMIIVA